MKISSSSVVSGTVSKVFARFDQNLFLALKPPYVPLVVNRFDGCQTGGELELDLGWAKWTGKIVDHHECPERAYFIDEGISLPIPLSFWRHTHLIEKYNESEVVIRDTIEFKTKPAFLEKAIYPFLKLFLYHRSVLYKEIFQ